MAFFALLWKARTIEKYRQNYEKEKINSIVLGRTQMEQTLSQRWRHYRHDTKKRISRTFQRWYPEGSGVANLLFYLKTDQTFANFLFKSVMGFVGGIILTYLCFMFFVFQLSISLIHATIMSSIIGVLLTLGLAFSYRIRCLVFLLIPQFFSRVGRYTLTCYALVLILTGPATNTLKNSEVLSESMACSQEHIKTSANQLNDLMKKPFSALKDSIKLMIEKLNMITMKMKETIVRLDRLVLSVVSVIQSSFSWLQSVGDICNEKLGTPYERCHNAMQDGVSDCQKVLGPDLSAMCSVVHVAQAVCYSVQPFNAFCYGTDFMDEAILATVKKKLRNFTDHLRAMFHVEIHMHHAYSFSSNTSRSASQVAAGIVTEIRNRADPLLTWLSWSSCVTSLFLLLIIFRAKYYQHMYETRSRFDNRYVTKELQDLDLKRQRQGRETVLPLNRRERAKYITTTSFRLVASEKVYLNRSAVFMAITTFKLLIHMVADYSLYWVLMTIRYHGRYQSDLMPGIPHSGVHISGNSFVARLFRSIVGILDIPLASPAPSPISCLPDPYPPDLRRYTQIGVLIFLLWFFALFEPYGLRLRHLIMGHYRPERAKARATWLYNHILRTRAGFMKFARRKLHREYKYSSEAALTFRQWVSDLIPFQCCRSLVGLGSKIHCLLCGTTFCRNDPDSQLTKCQTPGCPGVFCISCFTDIGELCTICLSPADYGDFSDVSLEKGSSDDSDSDTEWEGAVKSPKYATLNIAERSNFTSKTNNTDEGQRWNFFKSTGNAEPFDTIALISANNDERDFFATIFRRRLRKIKTNIRFRNWDKKYTKDWVAKLQPDLYTDFTTEDHYNLYSCTLETEHYSEYRKTSQMKSVGVNTDKKRGIVNVLVNNLNRWNAKRRTYKQKKLQSTQILYKRLLHIENGEKPTEYRNNKTILECNFIEFKKRPKSYNAHNLTIRQRNLRNIVSCKKTGKATDKIKVFIELGGITKAVRFFWKNNDIIDATNQNNGTTKNLPIENSKDIDKPSANTNQDANKRKKQSLKGDNPKRPRKIKDVKKVKSKNSPNKIAHFHTFFSNHWNNFKYSLLPCTSVQNRSVGPLSKERRNHKRRKKRKGCIDLNETDIDECFTRKDIKHTRNLRISAFLAELEWSKKDFKKNKKFDENEDSFLFTDGLPAPVTTNKLMLQMKNLPFQWREAPKADFSRYNDKNSISRGDKSDKYLKILAPISKHKMYAKKALERFRNKVTAVETVPSSLMQKMLSSFNVSQGKTSLKHETSICLSKRTSFYRTFKKEMLQDSELYDTDVIYKNEKYADDMIQDIYDPKTSSQFTVSNSLVGKDMIVSLSSNERSSPTTVPNPQRKCTCEIYDDLQKKWAHVKQSLSDKGWIIDCRSAMNDKCNIKKTLSIVKNFCSSLFGPSCTMDTCPHQQKKQDKKNIIKKVKKTRKDGKYGLGIQTDPPKAKKGAQAIQTQSQKHTETQLASDVDVAKEIEVEAEIYMQKEKEMERAKKKKQMELEKARCRRLLEQIPQEEKAPKLEKPCDMLLEHKAREAKAPKVEKPCKLEQPKLDECFYDTSDTTDTKTLTNTGIFARPETSSCACQAVECPNNCNQSIQYDKTDCKIIKKEPPINVKCYCDEAVQGKTPVCTCATQHVPDTKQTGTNWSPAVKVKLLPPCQSPRAVNNNCSDDSTKLCGPKKCREIKAYGHTGESDICLLDHTASFAHAMHECVSGSISELSSGSSMTHLTDDTKTDTTICSLATFDFDDRPRRRKFRVKVVTKTNQATLTDKARLCDTGTITSDWWSPIIERKGFDSIALEKKKGYNAIEQQKKQLRDLREWKEMRDARKRRRNCGVTTNGRIVTFRSRTQIIPTGIFPAPNDIMSPSRYLLESQKYYNELFSYNFHPPHTDYTCLMPAPKYQEKEKSRSPLGSRRNHHRKTKRLEECYSPRRQLSPRKRYTDSVKTSDSPRRRSYTHRHTTTRHHHSKFTPRKKAC